LGRASHWVIAGIAAFGIMGSPAHATLIAQVDLARLARDADAVVHGVVERTGTQMAYNASTSPWSVTQLRVLQWLSRGEGERLWIRDPGAVWANGGRPLSGAAVYTPGEEVIVFLRRDVGRYFRTHNLAAGKLVVRREGREAMVMQDLREVSILVAPPNSTIAKGEQTTLAPLHDVLAQLQFLLGARQ
jgi:hypothetical protein